MILQFDFNGYFSQPIVKYCHEATKKLVTEPITVLSLDDCLPDIRKLTHSKRALDEKKWSFIGDQLRLYYSMQYDNFLYLDGDVLIPDFRKIYSYKNCTDRLNMNGRITINNGTFFHSDRDCEFNKYYFDFYQNNPQYPMNPNTCVFYDKPYHMSADKRRSGDMDLIEIPNKHFYTSSFQECKRSFPDIDTVYITDNINFTLKGKVGVYVNTAFNYNMMQFLRRKECICLFWSVKIPFAGNQDTLLDLLKEQMNYVYGKTLKYKWVK